MLLFVFSLAYVGVTICSAAPLSSASSSQVLLPKPTGPSKVGRSVTELIDTSRPSDPFNSDPGPRKLMISVFYPASPKYPSSTEAYMLPETALIEDITLSSYNLTAPNGTFEKLSLHLASDAPIHNIEHEEHCSPLVVFMPAEGTTRLFYSQIASTIASKGYTVVTIDSPYDIDVVEYPDGSVALINGTLWGNPNLTELAEIGYLAISNRVQDVTFVLDSLSNITLANILVPNLPSTGLNTTNVAMFGHSLGGATAFSILDTDERILGGLDMDGGLFGPPLANNTSSKPFMFIGHDNYTREDGGLEADTWEAGWQNLTGWKREIVVEGALHYDFSDYPIVFETLGMTPNATVGQEIAVLVGSLGGERALEIVTTYVGAFLDFVLLGKESKLLDGPVEEFPEVTFDF